jgi:Telomere resolvase
MKLKNKMKPIYTPQEYFDTLAPLRNPEKIQSVCEQLTTSLFNDTDKPKTRINKLTPYNKQIKEICNDELIEGENAYIQTRADGSYWKRHLHFKFTGIADTNFNGREGINTKSIVLDRLENRQLVDVAKYLEITSTLLLSDDPHELAVGLIAASGRRLVEILARASFTICNDLPESLQPGYFVNFKGQAKKRDYDIAEDEKLEYRIGVLVPATFFIRAFRRFQLMPECKEILDFLKVETKKGTSQEKINEHINDRRGNSLRRVTQEYFGNFLPKRTDDDELNTKALRAVYLALITRRDCPTNINQLLWASRAMGHFVDSTNVSDRDLTALVTTLGYSDYYCDVDVPFIPAPTKAKSLKTMNVKILESDFETIKKLQKDWELPNQQTVVHNLIELAEKSKDLEQKLLDAEKHNAELKNLIDSDNKTIGLVTVQSNDYESLSMEDLKMKRGEGATDEKIKRAFLAITNHNDYKSRDKNGVVDIKLMYVVNNQALRQLSGCNGLAVTQWMKNHSVAIDDHNSKYGLGQYHNKGKGDITKVITIE